MTSRPSGIAGNQEPKSPNLYYYSHVLDLNTGLVRYSYSNCNININCFQAVSDLRQARRRHAVEMQHMARRPFATQSVVLEYSNAYLLEPYRQLAKCSTGKADQNSGSKKSHQVPLVFYWRRQVTFVVQSGDLNTGQQLGAGIPNTFGVRFLNGWPFWFGCILSK